MTTCGSNNRATHRTVRKPVITGSSKEQINLLRDAPKIVRAMERRGLVRFPGLASLKGGAL
jgi:hypothetical protein